MAWYDYKNMGSPFPLLDYGANKLANYASNALSNNQNNDFNTNWANTRRAMTQVGLDTFRNNPVTGEPNFNRGVYDPYGIKTPSGAFSYDMNYRPDRTKPSYRTTSLPGNADELEFEGGVPRGQNTDDILYNMDKIIANKEFNERPGIHFDDAPIENIFNRRNHPRKGWFDENFRYKELNNPEGINYDKKRSFGLSGILQGLKNQFQRPEEKQAAYEAIMGDRKPLGLWNTQSGNYGGNKYTLQRSPTGLKVYSEVNPYGKNFDSAFGSKSLEEMDEKTLAWAMDRLSKGKNISSRLTGILENRGRLDGSPGDGGGATRWQPDYEGAVAHQQQMAAKAGQTHEQFMSDLNEVRAKGGRVGYNEGGRVGILSVF